MAAFQNRLLVFFTTVLLGLLASTVRADGKAFTTSVLQPTMPDQRAMIVWDGSTQTLLIDTTLEGADAMTAWVVPVPAEPEVFEVDRGLFPTLQVIFQPRVLDGGGDGFAVVVLLVLACLVLLMAYARSREGWGCIAAAVFLFVGYLGVLVILPGIGVARGIVQGSGTLPAVGDASPVVSRERVGLYDVSILHGPETRGIVAWLEAEGFVIDQISRDAIAEYVAEGWWFVASKLAAGDAHTLGEGQGRGTLSPHPLGLRFAASEAVYPMRLTGTQGRDLRVDLFVFSDQMATVPGFEIRRCGEVRTLPRPELNGVGDHRLVRGQHWYSGPEVVVGQPQLRELVGDATTATWLAARLSPAEMGRDVLLTTGAVKLQGNTVISQSRARSRAFLAWAALLVVGSVVLLVAWRKETPARVVSCVAIIALVVVPAMLAGGVWLSDRGIPTQRTTSGRTVLTGHVLLIDSLLDTLADRSEGDRAWAATLGPSAVEAAVRESLHALATEAFDQSPGEWQNPILGIPM